MLLELQRWVLPWGSGTTTQLPKFNVGCRILAVTWEFEGTVDGNVASVTILGQGGDIVWSSAVKGVLAAAAAGGERYVFAVDQQISSSVDAATRSRVYAPIPPDCWLMPGEILRAENSSEISPFGFTVTLLCPT